MTKQEFTKGVNLTMQEYRKGNDKALQELATMLCLSVLKKCEAKSGNTSVFGTLRRELLQARADLATIERAGNCAYSHTYDKNGEYKQVITDKVLHHAKNACTDHTIGEGYSLINTAIVSILDEVKKQEKQGLKKVDMFREYTQKVLSKRVVIRLNDSASYTEKGTTPIQEVYLAIRRHIYSLQSDKVDINGYTYIQEDITSPDGVEDRLYYRFGKYADIGGYACDSNGKETLYSGDYDIIVMLREFAKVEKLTQKQVKTIELRLRGYGQRAIATYFGITPQAVQNALRKLQPKLQKFLDNRNK